MNPADNNGVEPKRLKAVLKDLIDIYSPSGKEEEIVDYVHRYLKRQGFSVTKQAVDEHRYNLIVFPENKNEVELCFIGHLDTVTAYDLDHFSFEEDQDIISGLGIADMKAGCAAMIEAFSVLAGLGDGMGSVGLALVVDEEEDNKGAITLVNEYSFPWAVVGEPTDLEPCLGHYSYLEVLLRTRGKRAHSAMPELGQNAIEKMLKLLLEVTEYIDSKSPELVYNIRELSGFPGGFVVPDACEAWLDLHLPPNSRIDVLKAEMEQLLEAAAEKITDLDAYLRFEHTYSGYRISHKRPMVRKLKEVYKNLSIPWHPQDFRSHSDGSVLWAAGVDPIIIGPGCLEVAHTPEESVQFDKILQAARIYLQFALSINSNPDS